MTALPPRLDPAGVEGCRGRIRTSDEDAATGLINAILDNPQATAAALVRDVQGGADPQAVVALLEAAANLAHLRGRQIDPFVRAMRNRLTSPATDPSAAARAKVTRLRSWLGVLRP